MGGPATTRSSKERLETADRARPAVRGTSRHAAARPDILTLQRTAGNRAVSGLLDRGTASQRPGAKGGVPRIVEQALAEGRGQPLDPGPRTEMERRFGADLGSVRVHTDARAAESAESLDAAAYTVGRHVVFGPGQYQPGTTTGTRLLGHELAHVLQQSSIATSATSAHLRPGATNAPAEAAADRASRALTEPAWTLSEHPGRLATQAEVGNLQVQRQATSSVPIEDVQPDVDRIKEELDSVIYTEGVEETVISILRRWAERGSLASGYLDWIFDGLQQPKITLLGDTTYYDAMLESFDRADEVRAIRDGSRRYRGRESVQETRRRAEAAAERRETDIAADVTGGWIENVAEPYALPATPEDLFKYVDLELRRLSVPGGRYLPSELKAMELVSKYGPQVLLRRVHFVTESERVERRKAQMREIAKPIIEILLWATAERLAAFAVEAIAARLFAAEARGAVALVAGEGETAVSVLARRGAAEGELLSAEGSLIAREGYAYRIESIDAVTGDVVAIGRDEITGEVVTVQMNVDTGAGFATRASGETLPIRGGRVDLAGARRSLGEGPAAMTAPERAAGEATRGTELTAGARSSPAPGGRQLTRPLEDRLQAMQNRLDLLSNHPDAPVMQRDLDSIRGWASRGRDYEAGELLNTLSRRVEAAKLSRSAGMLEPLYQEAEESAALRVIEYRPAGGRAPLQLDPTAPLLTDDTGQRLLRHVENAIQRFEAEGLTGNQLARLKILEAGERHTLYDAYRGSRIDEFAKEAVMNDPELEHVYVTVLRERGPDFFNSRTGVWYDITTTGAWKAHLRSYGAAKVPGFRLPTEVLP